MNKETKKRRKWPTMLLALLTICMLTVLFCGGALFWYMRSLPTANFSGFAPLVAGQGQNTLLFYYESDENGNAVPHEWQQLRGTENRQWVSYSEMPQYLLDAFVAIEDERFYLHHGVDLRRTIGAVLGYVGGATHYGGSTITQQLVKNLTGEDDVTVRRKLTEIKRARMLEQQLTKEQILELYLNTIYLSQHSYGVGAAAEAYFGKAVSELTLAECAALAAIPQAPTKWDPVRDAESNRLRRQVVLDKMRSLDKITSEEHAKAVTDKLQLVKKSTDAPKTVYDWYTESVIGEAIPLLQSIHGVDRATAEKMLYNGGYRIYTAMDPFVQKTMHAYFENAANFPRVDDSFVQPECAMVVLDPHTGAVRGIIGGRGEKKENRILNLATQALRPPGSSIKPVAVYGPALEHGLIHAGSVFDDVPVNFTVRADGWPVNYPAGYRGLTTVGDAITRSVNTVAVRVLERLGVDASYSFLEEKLGLSSLVDDNSTVTDRALAPLALGQLSYGVSVKELTAAYTGFADGGRYHDAYTIEKILSADGKLLWQKNTEGTQVFRPENAQIMTNMLREVTAQGTASRMGLKRLVSVAGKTGTTTADRDRWFVGYTPYYVAGVWFGYATPRELTGFPTLPSPAVATFDRVMTALHAPILSEAKETGERLHDFSDTGKLIRVAYCKDSGGIPTSACRADPRGGRIAYGYFTADNCPSRPCSCHKSVACAPGGGVYCDQVPLSDVRYYGLLQIPHRNLDLNVPVLDAQYVYRPLGTVAPCVDGRNPFFYHALKGKYVGISPTSKPFNRGVLWDFTIEDTEAQSE